ncbi:amidohydrolase [Burkholderia ubonensis]|uniref:amidohydrolase family protein n=1 Tax=Burkholderia ubonensis TaxID=101571 RepID=UPI00075D19DB|nr:amidohydrolase family protein [Burkholderia ubonensis]KVR15525.1 amidohydrolase [Burkholderia ubonensis]KVR18812.1 amidohydrolase [Burkholderia ubonensis]KWD16786.1 amidohydrolase [Burkholderia ubonensis]KWD18507.1 amidohydrolase [Burkholderia ubonensis]
MDETVSIKRRRMLGAAAASLALPGCVDTRAPAQHGVSRMTTQSNYLAVRLDWLASALEPALEPELPIVDAHHHFYERPGWIYMLDDYLQDARSSGHNIQASVYMQAQTRYREAGPAELKPAGETAYVAGVTEPLRHGRPAVAKGIVGHADLRLGARVRDVLEAHLEAGRGRFRGVRHLTTWDADPTLANPLSAVPRGLLLDPAYRAGVAQLASLGLSYDAWLFFPQLPELFDLAKANPETKIIVNHCGGVVRIASYADRRPEVFKHWSASMRMLAQLPNVYVKVGGLGMRINGFDFEKGARPPSSKQLADEWKPWMLTCIDAFGAERCMFESNFPVDKGSYSYVNGWNAFKRLTAHASADERDALFRGTVTRVYRLD